MIVGWMGFGCWLGERRWKRGDIQEVALHGMVTMSCLVNRGGWCGWTKSFVLLSLVGQTLFVVAPV